MTLDGLGAYALLFVSAFGAATILPFYSEVMFVALLEAGHDPLGLWLSATTGNTLGSVVNWLIGWHYARFAGTRWFPLDEKHLARGRRWFGRYGYWTLLFAWLPVGGDALTFVGGIMRIRLGVFLVLVAIGKGARYALLLAGYQVF